MSIFVVSVAREGVTTRIVVGCEDMAQWTYEEFGRRGLTVNRYQAADVPLRTDAERARAKALLDGLDLLP